MNPIIISNGRLNDGRWIYKVWPYAKNQEFKDFQGFEDWLEKNCLSSKYQKSYNNGDPILEVYFKDYDDVIIMLITWGDHGT